MKGRKLYISDVFFFQLCFKIHSGCSSGMNWMTSSWYFDTSIVTTNDTESTADIMWHNGQNPDH